MAIRLSGLTSGMDTDAIVQELVSAYSKKTEKYEKASTKLTWKQDAWKELNTKIYSLYTSVSNLRFSSAYNLKKTSVSDATKATVTASSSAVTGTQKLNIKSTAQSSYMTGAALGEDVTADTTLEELGYTGNYTTVKYKTADGTKEIGLKKDMKISDVLAELKEVGLNASFDENNGRIFVNAKTSGEKSDFTLIGDSEDAYNALDALGLNSALIEYEYNEDGTVKSKKFTEAAGSFAVYYKYMEGYIEQPQQKDYGLGTPADGNSQLVAYDNSAETAFWAMNALYNNREASIEDRIARVYDTYVAYFKANDAAKIAYNTIDNQNGAYENLNKLYEGQIEDAADRVYDAAIAKDEDGNSLYSFEAPFSKDDIRVLMEKAGEVMSEESSAEAIKAKLQEDYPLSSNDADVLVKLFTAQEADIKEAVELKDKIDANNTAVENNNATLEKLQTQMDMYQQFIDDNADMASISTKDGKGNELTGDALKESITSQLNQFVEKAKKAEEIYTDAEQKYSKTDDKAVKIAGSNAEIELNGVKYTSETNSFVINGLTINTLATTDGEISITTTVDSQGIYDKVKEFLTEYNNVINEMTKLYNAESASDYEPLTDEEKEAMSDEQIEKWETKIKDSLLRRDTTLNSIMSVMINSMAQVIEIDGVKLSLSTFGIGTLGFLNAPENEQYAYHIDGDDDDENTSGKEDKLMAAIEANPEQIEEFMKQLAANLYTAIDNKMKSTELSSAYKVYNDKEMDSELTKYAEAISKWEDKVADKEDYYYNKFTQMEVALAKLQEQTSSISSLLGV